MQITRLAITFAAVGLLQLAVSLRPASAQEMYFSLGVYLDSAADASAVYSIVDTGDYSSGCAHSQHFTTAQLFGPSGWDQHAETGFSSAISLGFEEGDFTVAGSLTLVCDCAGTVGAGDSEAVSIKTTYFRNPVYGGDGYCVYYNTNCISSNPTCGELPHVMWYGASVCPPYVRIRFLYHNGCWDVGVASIASGGGTCT